MAAVSEDLTWSNRISNLPPDLSRTQQQERSLEHACMAARILDEFRGQDVVVLDLTKVTPIVDYFVMATGTSSRQMRAIGDEVSRVLKREGSRPIGVEGQETGTWILQDYGDIVVHLFTPETRKLYDLEHLWADAPRVDWKARCGSVNPTSAT